MSDFVQNKKAYFDYEFLEQYEAGVVLTGHEVKSLRAGKASLNGAYVIIRGKEDFWVTPSISPSQPPNAKKGYEPGGARKLLFGRKRLEELEQGSEKQG